MRRDKPASWLSLRDRFRPEVVGIAVLAVLALVCAGLIAAVIVRTDADAARAAREAAAYTPPPLSSPGTSRGGSKPIVAVIGDETVLRSAAGVASKQRWPGVLSAAGDVQVQTFASADAGYVAEGGSGDDYSELAAKVPAGAAAVVFVGGAADAGSASLSIARAATQAIAAARERAPDADVFVVSPLFTPADTSDSEIASVRVSLQSAARIASVRFVDPIRSGWLPSIDAAVSLTAANEQTIAMRVRTMLGSSID